MSVPPASIRVRAYAKINLTLRVLGTRPDGYHELRTTFQSLALHDTLTLAATRVPFTITTDTEDCPVDRTNLVWRAAEQLWLAAGSRRPMPGVHVHMTKRIPMQAGLGGGSADAAAALRALRVLWRLRVPDAVLEEVARGLGADVAFFLEGGTVLGAERGDLLFPLQDAPPAWVVIARPDFGVSTRDAYAWWDAAQTAKPRRSAQARLARTGEPRRSARATSERRREWVNDLQPAVVERHPRILQLVRTLERRGSRFAAMSGSGSAVFGLFDSRPAAAAGSALGGAGTTVWLTRTTTRREYARSSAPIEI